MVFPQHIQFIPCLEKYVCTYRTFALSAELADIGVFCMF